MGLSIVGLRAAAMICMGGPALMLSVTMALHRLGYQSRLWLEPDLAMIAAGLLAAPFAFLPGLRAHARLAGWLLGCCIGLDFTVTPVVAPDAFPARRAASR